VVDEAGTSTVWDDLFPTDQAALDEALKTFREEGMGTFLVAKQTLCIDLVTLLAATRSKDRGLKRQRRGRVVITTAPLRA